MPLKRGFVRWVHDQPETIRVGITAAIGTVFAWATYEIVHAFNPFEPRATSSWVIAFMIGIVRQHHLHRTLSFPKNGVPYGVSLWRDTLASVAILGISAGLNYGLTVQWGLNHRAAWLVCLLAVSLLDYALMKFFVFHKLLSARRKG